MLISSASHEQVKVDLEHIQSTIQIPSLSALLRRCGLTYVLYKAVLIQLTKILFINPNACTAFDAALLQWLLHGRGLGRGQCPLPRLILMSYNLQRKIYASATAHCALAGSALRASPMELLAQAAQQQKNHYAAHAHFGPLIFTHPRNACSKQTCRNQQRALTGEQSNIFSE